MDVTGLIDRYCAVWNEPDVRLRADGLAALWAEGARYSDPSVATVGAAELLVHIAGARDRWPGLRLTRTSAVDGYGVVARFAWRAENGGEPLVEGLDIVHLAADGTRIERIIGFFGPLDTAEGRG